MYKLGFLNFYYIRSVWWGKEGLTSITVVGAEVKGQLAGVGPLLPPCVPGTEPRSSVLGLGILASESSCLLFWCLDFFLFIIFQTVTELRRLIL